MPRMHTVLIPFLHDRDDVFEVSFPADYKPGDRLPPDMITPDKQVFTYTPKHTGETLHIAIGKLNRMVQAQPWAFPEMEAVIVPKQVRQVMRENGVELAYLRTMDRALIDVPGLLLRFEEADGPSHAIIDGNHRYVLRFAAGFKTMMFREVTLEQVKPCLLALPPGFNPITGEWRG